MRKRRLAYAKNIALLLDKPIHFKYFVTFNIEIARILNFLLKSQDHFETKTQKT